MAIDQKYAKGVEILYGIHPVLEAMTSARRRFFELYTLDQKRPHRLEKIFSLAESGNVTVSTLTRSQLDAMAGTAHHQGIAAKVGVYPFADISNMTRGIDPFLLLLDNMLDPHNLGALIRTALCSGVHGIVIPKDRSAGPTPTVSKSSAGALEHARIARVGNLVNTIKTLKDGGIWVVGLDQHAERSIFESDLKGPIALVVGGEGKGIRPLVKKNCDFLTSIPQQGPVGSLNASVAGAIAMYEVLRQRHE